MRLLFEPIGEVRCPGLPVGPPWGTILSELHFRPSVAMGLEGIQHFSHLLVVFFMHQAAYTAERDLVRRPGGRQDMPRVGIFAQRASSRPNALGVSVVRLLSQEAAVLSVQGLDAFDGSPILDVKPYVSEFDRATSSLEPEWLARLMRGYF
jgi:tRNA-Thr(GGU) m(6)t(6)A37 methyltransferase TsaA